MEVFIAFCVGFIVGGIFGVITMAIVLRNTEEKWLYDLYGKEYDEYKKRVNRCFPWIPKRTNI